MIFLCSGLYFASFLHVQQRRSGRWLRPHENSGVWLAIGLLLATFAYAARYGAASGSSSALVLLAGVTLGKGVAVWSVRRGQETQSEERVALLLTAFALLLLCAAVWHPLSTFEYQYRGTRRWGGPWHNPNAFGCLMGVGMTLSVGQMARIAVAGLTGGERASEIKRKRSCGWRWLRTAALLCAATLMGAGWLKSYSRGAWLAAGVAFGYVGYQVLGCPVSPKIALFRALFFQNWVPLLVAGLFLSCLCLWGLRETERTTLRRMVSLANAKDFSWRKRVAAGEAGLVMMAEKPFAGFGWNQPERVYAHFYQAPKVDEGMAFQLNDYVTLGTTLGLPALACFVAYAGLSLRGQEKREVEEGRWDDGRWLRVTCRAGAIVLLVGFFFDGGLLQLATGATFWILLELGKENGRWEMEERRAG